MAAKLSPEQNWFRCKAEIDPTTGCWNWRGPVNWDGYGKVRKKAAHRYSWELFKEEPVGNLCVLHKCDNPSCVNPEHLFLGTIADNNLDCKTKGRRNSGILY